jgi:hypothetical protein
MHAHEIMPITKVDAFCLAVLVLAASMAVGVIQVPASFDDVPALLKVRIPAARSILNLHLYQST